MIFNNHEAQFSLGAMKTDLVNLIFNNYKGWVILALLKLIWLICLKV